jgi:demethylmenaquinone methyltransferase/2-methoxy-6-polyprenyl-1,4-benzoquinol methylase
VVGLDLTLRMIELATAKCTLPQRAGQSTRFAVADMMALPLRAASVDVITTGYGLRNVPRLEPVVDEIARVLKPGGQLASLDFNRPRLALVRGPYLAYLTVVGAALGWVLHRDPDTYRYIPESVRRYPGADGVAELLRSRGFHRVRIIPVLGGLMSIHLASK